VDSLPQTFLNFVVLNTEVKWNKMEWWLPKKAARNASGVHGGKQSDS